VHAAFSNSSRFPLALSLKPYANLNWIGEEHLELFREIVNWPLAAHPPLEICEIIYNHFPAQVAGLHPFLESRAEDVP
jgi:hypothetical protein